MASLDESNAGGLYSPADFQDAEDIRPLAAVFDIGSNGSSTPYTTATNGLIMKHVDEIKQKVTNSLALPSTWKKRLRDFLSKKNTELLDYLKLSIKSHPTLGRGEAILQKFGNVNIHANHPSIRDLVLDLSGVDRVAQIETILVSMKSDNGTKNFTECVQFIYDEYRKSGDEALKQESLLKKKLETLDRIQGKVCSLLEIDSRPSYQPLMEASEAYLKNVFDDNQIAETYQALIEGYRRFITMRDIVLMMRAVESNENEPLCTICLDEIVSSCFSPCGHTFCTNCIRKQSGTCFICRTPIKEKIRLFFS